MGQSNIEKRAEVVKFSVDTLQWMAFGFMPSGDVVEEFLNFVTNRMQMRILNFTQSIIDVISTSKAMVVSNYEFSSENFFDLIDRVFKGNRHTNSEVKLEGSKGISI